MRANQLMDDAPMMDFADVLLGQQQIVAETMSSALASLASNNDVEQTSHFFFRVVGRPSRVKRLHHGVHAPKEMAITLHSAGDICVNEVGVAETTLAIDPEVEDKKRGEP